jgi:hypothetical protein
MMKSRELFGGEWLGFLWSWSWIEGWGIELELMAPSFVSSSYSSTLFMPCDAHMDAHASRSRVRFFSIQATIREKA